MGFFDNVKNSFTETSQDLTKKAKDTTEIFRLNNLNKTKEKEIEKVIYQIGLAFYSNKRRMYCDVPGTYGTSRDITEGDCRK